jgi:LysM repeat protein
MNNISATSRTRLAATSAGLVAALTAIGVIVAVASRHLARPSADTPAQLVSRPAPIARDQGPLAAAQKDVADLVAALAGLSPPPVSGDGTPDFDIVRVEPSGEAVIAGHAAPGATVELLRNGEVHDRAIADQSGQFVMIPRPLPRGTYDLTLRARQGEGKELTSRQSVAVALEAAATDAPMVALMSPDKPPVVLSRPPAAPPVAETVAVEAVEVEPGGKTHVSGRGRPGATVRLYLNDSFVASATTGADGRLSLTINEGVVPGSYRVRLDQLDSNSGKVSARAEVPFDVPDLAITASVPATKASGAPDDAAARPPQLAAAVANAAPDGTSPSAVVVPKIATVTVTRGDSLWRISRRALGDGARYAIVYRTNRAQIRDPNLIYPGQVIVLPTGEAR